MLDLHLYVLKKNPLFITTTSHMKLGESKVTDCGFAEGPRLTSSRGEEDGECIWEKK